MDTTKIIVQVEDEQGKHANACFYVPGLETDPEGAVASAWANQVKALSDGAVKSVELNLTDVSDSGTSDDGPYEDSEDKAVFEFVDAKGQKYHISVPAPDEDIFLDDKETVDVTNVAVEAFYTEIETDCRSRDGNAITFSGRAYRTRGKRHRILPVG